MILKKKSLAGSTYFRTQTRQTSLPLSEAVEAYVSFAQHPDMRVRTGIAEIDDATRGVAPGELCIINGYSHNGKSVLMVELIMANEGRPLLLFTPDETRTIILAKLAAAIYGISAETIEQRLEAGDQQTIEMLDAIAQRFKKLAVFDEPATLHMMDRAKVNVEAAFGEPVVAALFDYADLLNEPLETNEKIKALKVWGKRHDLPFILLHQSSRSGGAGGKEVSMTSGAYGGEQQATFLIGVRRKINFYRDQIRVLEEKMENTQNPQLAQRLAEKIDFIQDRMIPASHDTISISLIKNKRPPMRLVPEIDFRLIAETGRLVPMVQPGELPDRTPIEAPDLGEQGPYPQEYPNQAELGFQKSARQLLAERRNEHG
jgi:KaiC/GvpD/RAD55 family RecA-like ATPase